MYTIIFKRFFDFTASLVGLILVGPLFAVITFGLYVANSGKPFFIQLRPGRYGKVFKIVKFKTMNDKTDLKGNLLSDAERLTKIGSFVRKTSIDEIPQLINVIKGDMSLIGPRPLLTQYLHLYSDFQNRRHEVRPGITGWAQVNGRNAISWDRKFELDVWYVDNISLFLDIKILYKTILKVIMKEGVNSASSATMEPFQGQY